MSAAGGRGDRPRVVLLRGHHANVWDLRPWEGLREDFDVQVLVTGSNVHQVSGLQLDVVGVRTPRDALPGGRLAGAAAYAVGERYLGLADRLAGADIVHGAEIGTWHSAQAARLKTRLGFRLVVTVWETIPWREAYRWPRERAYRQAVLPAADLFLPTTERAREGLLLEGVDPERIQVCPPGIDLDRFATAAASPAPPADGTHRILSAGRLVWEKGHQDVLRAFAALRLGIGGPPRDDVRLLIVGDGPERGRLERYARDLGVGADVAFRATVPYDDMPSLYASASCLVLASLPTRSWEEQFGMVLVEALTSRTPVIASATGAIPEVLAGAGTLTGPGDWPALAQAIRQGPLTQPPATRTPPPPPDLHHFSTHAATRRYGGVYSALIEAPLVITKRS